jgi:protein-tyrosine-phosphatase
MSEPFKVLVLCTGNSARSILAECLLNRRGEGRIQAFSAGSHPKPAPHPLALALLAERGFDTSGLSSKSWNEFTGKHAPPLDLVITVCGNAAEQTCPMWSGTPVQAHWGVDDPAGLTEAEQRPAFERAYRELDHKITELVKLDFETLTPEALRTELDRIARLWP